MKAMRMVRGLAGLSLVVGLMAAAASAYGQTAPPSFSVQHIGTGSVVAINNRNTMIGYQTNPSNYTKSPIISEAGGPWTALPLPAGATAGFPTDLNDVNVIVGVADLPAGRRAVRWAPAGAGYEVEVLPLLPGETASYGSGINNLGQIVGSRPGLFGTPYYRGWLYSDATGPVDLYTTYGWSSVPGDINDAGVILSGTQIFDLNTLTVTDVGNPQPTGYNLVQGVAINNSGQIVGQASLSSSSLNIISVFRYLPGSGWQYISGTSKYTFANDINNHADVCWGEQGAGIYFDGLGRYSLYTLLEPAAAAAGWLITGNGCLVNDLRVVAAGGRNTITGKSGVVLLTPVGQLPPPAAPTGLTATPHPATSSEPYVSINLSWNNGDVLLTRTYELERRFSGQATWTSIPLVAPGMSTFHQDTTVAPATTCDYRVRAVGVAGPGPWSAMATATSPATPLDTTPPVVTILTPADGASVSGNVSISTQATDNVGVEYLEISYWNQYLGQEVVLGSVDNAGSLTVNWDTRGLAPATYTVRAFANDGTRNWTQAEISVNVAASPKTMIISDIGLSATRWSSKVNVTGNVYVKDGDGRSVAGADVTARWSLPGGGTRTSTIRTDSSGRARFSTSGGRGTYSLTVTGVAKQGYVFNAAGSVLFRSITR